MRMFTVGKINIRLEILDHLATPMRLYLIFISITTSLDVFLLLHELGTKMAAAE
jgi:hypothetical protein